jgi:hypothetical protein
MALIQQWRENWQFQKKTKVFFVVNTIDVPLPFIPAVEACSNYGHLLSLSLAIFLPSV